VLVGTFAATYFVLQPGNFRLVYGHVFGRRMTIYRDLALLAALSAAVYFSCGFVMRYLSPPGEGWLQLALQAVVCAAVAAAITFAGLWFMNDGFRLLVRRFLGRRPVISKDGAADNEL
jgi:hypothetical protein